MRCCVLLPSRPIVWLDSLRLAKGQVRPEVMDVFPQPLKRDDEIVGDLREHSLDR